METLHYKLGEYWQAWSSVINSGGDSIFINCLGRKKRHIAVEAAAAWKAAQWVVLGFKVLLCVCSGINNHPVLSPGETFP